MRKQALGLLQCKVMAVAVECVRGPGRAQQESGPCHTEDGRE